MAAFSRIERLLPAVVPMNYGTVRILLRKLLNYGINAAGAISFWDTGQNHLYSKGKVIMKKILAVLLVLLLVVKMNVLGCAEEAEQETYISGNYEYRLLEDGTAEIVKYKGSDQDISIPEQLDDNTVSTLGDHAFAWRDSLTSVTIPDSVTSIGAWTFEGCNSLTSVTIPAKDTFRGFRVRSHSSINGSKPSKLTVVNCSISKR